MANSDESMDDPPKGCGPWLRAIGCLVLACSLFCSLSGALAGALADEPLQPMPPSLHQNAARAAIGQRLFGDVRLSTNGRLSCASCHDLSKGGADNRARTPGMNGKLSPVNVPTVFNAALNLRQFWNGRAETLEDQVDQVIRNPDEMDSTWPEVVRRLSLDATYRKAFDDAYADGLTKSNVQNAIASFERTLITPNSRFDRYLRGERQALSEEEQRGYAKFKHFGCVACHQGVNIGGNMFQKFGVMGDYFATRDKPTPADQGRFQVTGLERDRHVFKVPSLRNVALTAPYFHDGSAATLEQAVEVMFRYQLGRQATVEDKALIVRFLNTLTDETRVAN